MIFTRRQIITVATAAVIVLGLSTPASAADMKYNLLPNKPFAGKKLNILSVVTPQFSGLMLRDKEFTELTGIKTEWTFIPFGSLQEKVAAEGVAANGAYDVVNYLDSWGPPNAHWLMPIDDLMKRDGPGITLAPNVSGERVESWADAQKLAASKGKDTSSYESLVRKERSTA